MRHKSQRTLLALCATFLSYAALAADSAPSESKQPWQRAQALVNIATADIQSAGIRAIAGRVPDLEQALADAPKTPFVIGPDSGTIYVLVDGMGEALIATAEAAEAMKSGTGHKKVDAVSNPYPATSLYLGSYYDDTGAPDSALRVLDEGLASSTAYEPLTGGSLGEHRPQLISERGTALISLKRWTDALADYDDGLKLSNLKAEDHARLLRGRGFALTELGRLDEAEAAYNESLKLEPKNALAQNELKYIAQLRATGITKPVQITLPEKKTR
jgi:tetratricopeptide (TPR) repeat protein